MKEASSLTSPPFTPHFTLVSANKAVGYDKRVKRVKWISLKVSGRKKINKYKSYRKEVMANYIHSFHLFVITCFVTISCSSEVALFLGEKNERRRHEISRIAAEICSRRFD